MNDLFSRFFRSEDGGTTQMMQWAPQVNLSETDQSYEVSVDLPGVKLEDIDVELKHGELWICGTRSEESEDKGKTWHCVERFHGDFRRVIRLGDDVDAENVNADYKEGVLHVTVPKSENAQTKKITIKS
jgi:HSP20 family protein